MKFLRALFGNKRNAQDANAVESLEQSYRDTIGSIVDEKQALQRRADAGDQAVREVAVTDILTNINAKVKSAESTAAQQAPSVNIWDMDEGGGSTGLPDVAPTLPGTAPASAAAAAARSPGRARRTKTRLIGFDKSDGDVVDIFNDAPKTAPAQRAKFPVGWIVVADGPGRGESFSLLAGMSQIGRGEDQAVQLDFGDNSISRTNHAAIVYDPDNKEFLLGHGGKSNIVRLNDKPLISNEKLTSGDTIRIGETMLRFIALCDENFSWSDGKTEEDDDVAIA